MVYFWACEVSESKSAVVKVPEGFVLNVCNATLASDATASTVSLGLETSQMDNKAWKGVVAHLGAAVHAHQVKLDLVFTAQSKFYVAKGTGKINLTGYFQPGPPADFFEGATTTTEAATPTSDSQSSKKNKKRARDEPVTWDQVSPSDSEDEEAKPKAKTAAAPAKPAAAQQKSKPATATPVANGASAAEGSSKKKHRKNKNKKVHADKKD
ncbi:hypothetical protein Gpo141_00001381 [Globisporangium polare]